MNSYKFIISGGGTGGHIFPAIAIADGLKKEYPDASFLFVGAQGKMEMQKVPKAGYPIKGLWISGLSRKISLRLFLFPLKLCYSLLQAFFILLRFRPNLVVGTGGYASAPLLKMAQFMGIATLLQEQNSYAGVTNKWLAQKAKAICVAYPGMEAFFPEKAIRLTGNPIRPKLTAALPARETAMSYFKLDPSKPSLLILGGSLGAKKINEFVAGNLSFFEEQGFQLLWQCGALYYEQYRTYEREEIRVVDFISDMPMAYSAATVAISRAGAGAVSELMVVGLPTVFIPSPNVAEDHQTKNALSVTEMGAGYMVSEKHMHQEFQAIFKTICLPETQLEIKRAMKLLAKPQATEAIVAEINKMIAL